LYYSTFKQTEQEMRKKKNMCKLPCNRVFKSIYLYLH